MITGGLDSGLLTEALDLLSSVGRSKGAFLPWHSSRDPYRWLVAEILLRRTRRTVAERLYLDLISAYPTLESLAQAEPHELRELVAWAGLGKVRVSQLSRLSAELTQNRGGNIPCERTALLELPGVGSYIADALLLHVFGQKVLPIDAAGQRVSRRLLGLPTSSHTRHALPEKDPVVRELKRLACAFDIEELRLAHLGLLVVSWETCRRLPRCLDCSLLRVCFYAKRKRLPQ